MTAPTTKIDGAKMTDEWRTAFDDRHEFDVYPEHFMSGLRNEFAAGWHAAMKSQARALLASKGAVPMERTPVAWVLPDMGNREYSGVTLTRSKPIAEKHNGKPLYYAEDLAPTAPAQPCGDAEQADEAVTDAARLDYLESLRARGISEGFYWDTWHFTCKESDLTIRQQIDAARAKDSK